MDSPITFEQVLEWVLHNIVQICLVLSVFIQIAPIKINPWSHLFKWIGKLINSESDKKIDEVIKKVDLLKQELTEAQKSIDENEKDRIRWEILDFATSCRNGQQHTQDEFLHIITLNDKYRQLLAKTKETNGVFDVEYEYIKNLYAEKQKTNDFL